MERPTLWLRLPKNAGTSIENTLDRSGLVCREGPTPGRIVAIGGGQAIRFRDRNPEVWERALRFERLPVEWAALCAELGLPPLPLRHDKRGARERDYRAYYDAETRRLVAEIFARDIELLGYEF